MKEIQLTLRDHNDMEGTRICHECRGCMLPCTIFYSIQMKKTKVTLANIKAYKCTNCEEILFLSSEVKLMEEAIYPYRTAKKNHI